MQEESTLETYFDIGNVDGYEPPKEDAFPHLEASKPEWIPGPDGKRVRTDNPRYLFKITTPGKPGQTRWDGMGLVARATSVYPAKTEPRRRVSMAIEIPRFPSADEVRATILADPNIMDSLKEEKIAEKTSNLGKAKGRLMLLAKALTGSDNLKGLATFLQSTDAEGALFAAAVSYRTWEGGGANNFTRFYPASEATEPLPE